MDATRAYTITTAVLVALLIAGALQSMHIRYLREAKSFYAWIQAAATDERLLQTGGLTAGQDGALYAKVNELAEVSLAGETPAAMLPGSGDTVLEQLVADQSNNWTVWDFAKSDAVAGLRQEFLDLGREGRLEFARNLEIADLQQSQVSLFNAFFGFRKLAANLLWIQVDREWRVGQMYRLVPLLRSVVLLDPQFVRAYLIGGWHIGYNVAAGFPKTPPSQLQWSERYEACVGPREALYYEAAEFLKDGIRNNPRNYELYFDLGFSIYSEKIEDYDKAILYLSEAVKQPHEKWVPRMLNLAYEKNGQYEEALQGWLDYKDKYVEGFDTADRFIVRNQALIAREESERLENQAEATEDADAREQLRAQAEAKEDEARAKFAEMNEPFGDAYLLFMDAEDLVEQDRHFEAVAKLQAARTKTDVLFDMIKDEIIEVKQAGGIPLNVTERKQLVRESERRCVGEPEEPIEVTTS